MQLTAMQLVFDAIIKHKTNGPLDQHDKEMNKFLHITAKQLNLSLNSIIDELWFCIYAENRLQFLIDGLGVSPDYEASNINIEETTHDKL